MTNSLLWIRPDFRGGCQGRFSAGVGEPNSWENGTADSIYSREAVAECRRQREPWVRPGAEGRFHSHPTVLRHSGAGRGETMHHLRALMYVPANTGITVGFGPENFSPWNERDLACI